MNLYFVGGSKGGVGKSMMSIALCDYLTAGRGKKIKLIESDTANPDVGKIYSNDERVDVTSLRLDDADGWIDLVNICEQCETDIIVNSAARANEAISDFGGTLISALEELKMDMISFWVINRQRDSLELLKSFMEIVPGRLHVVRNTFYGPPNKFELFNTSNIRTEAEKRGATIDLDALADRVADDLYSQRITIDAAIQKFPMGNRSELKRTRSSNWGTFEGIGIA